MKSSWPAKRIIFIPEHRRALACGSCSKFLRQTHPLSDNYSLAAARDRTSVRVGRGGIKTTTRKKRTNTWKILIVTQIGNLQIYPCTIGEKITKNPNDDPATANYQIFSLKLHNGRRPAPVWIYKLSLETHCHEIEVLTAPTMSIITSLVIVDGDAPKIQEGHAFTWQAGAVRSLFVFESCSMHLSKSH
ncbi:hypothetical protein GWI33_013261 [Rhynchophorus ferrugineus]|uniref:Uncharacterized protein n=1 Tax=Rhynchophorus ferrugineus TaxID=354439 RepID=A0A834I436_RHYFE|nr:hypothetical protein GWI33_013261 [Rhynchophorus ferrugineus]